MTLPPYLDADAVVRWLRDAARALDQEPERGDDVDALLAAADLIVQIAHPIRVQGDA